MNRCAALAYIHHARRIEPDQAHWAVVAQQFLHLRLGLSAQVLVEILAVVRAEIPGVSGAVRLVPVLRLRIVEAEPDVVPRARRRQFAQRIAVKRGRVPDVVLAHRRMVHGEPVVMLAGDHDVLHPGIFGHPHPFLGIELHRIEVSGELLVLLHRDLGAVHDPLADPRDRLSLPLTGRNRVQPPVNEKAELCLPEPLHLRILGSRCRERFRQFLRRRPQAQCQQSQPTVTANVGHKHLLGVLSEPSHCAPILCRCVAPPSPPALRGSPRGAPPKKILKYFCKILDKKLLNCYYQFNTDSIPGGESPPTATL